MLHSETYLVEEPSQRLVQIVFFHVLPFLEVVLALDQVSHRLVYALAPSVLQSRVEVVRDCLSRCHEVAMVKWQSVDLLLYFIRSQFLHGLAAMLLEELWLKLDEEQGNADEGPLVNFTDLDHDLEKLLIREKHGALIELKLCLLHAKLLEFWVAGLIECRRVKIVQRLSVMRYLVLIKQALYASVTSLAR